MEQHQHSINTKMKTHDNIELVAKDNEEWRFYRLHRVIGFIEGTMGSTAHLIRLVDYEGDLTAVWSRFEPKPSMRHALSRAWETAGHELYDNVTHTIEPNQ